MSMCFNSAQLGILIFKNCVYEMQYMIVYQNFDNIQDT